MSENRLKRMFNPKSVAVVGISDGQSRSTNVMQALGDANVDLYLVNPKHPHLYGRDCYPDLQSIGHPVDTVLSLVNARASVDVVRASAELDCGGVVVIAGGFRESGASGAQLEQELIGATNGSMPVVGPNCIGFINVLAGVRVSVGPPSFIPPGGIGIVSQSGAFLRPILAAGADRDLGFSIAISQGNQAVTDMADYLSYLSEDDETRVICMVAEGMRRPKAFVEAAKKCVVQGKPVIMLLLGRGARAQQIAVSHTGALVGDVDAYRIGLRQIGVSSAKDIDDMLDQACLLTQLPSSKWVAVNGLGLLSSSGGGAGLGSDLCEEEGIPLPELEDLAPAVADLIPGTKVANPLDLTGFVLSKPDIVSNVVRRYSARPEIDALMLLFPLGEGDDQFGKGYIDPFVAEAQVECQGKPFIMSSPTGSKPAEWTSRLRESGIAVGHGLRGTIRGLSAMRTYMNGIERASLPIRDSPPVSVNSQYRHAASLPFCLTMDLLSNAGIPVAPYALLQDGEVVTPDAFEFSAPYVVKLADVPHRTDQGVVHFDVNDTTLAQTVDTLRRRAGDLELPASVVIQPSIDAAGELLLGIRQVPGLGPLVILGLGGVMVELTKAVSIRLAPVRLDDVEEMVDELGIAPLFRGFRNGAAWSLRSLAEIVGALGSFALDTQEWLDTLDINPLLGGPSGYVAVDALIVPSAP
jgi:acyl-CoA synthetase (NDP forming)